MLSRKSKADGQNSYSAEPPGSTSQSCSSEQSASDEEQTEDGWVEVELIGEDDSPIAGESCKITLPDGSTENGVTNLKGVARIPTKGFPSGMCRVSFPNLDDNSWEVI